MADEFIKGFGILSGAGLIWMMLAGWYRTDSFGGKQFTAARPENPSTIDSLGLLLMDAMFWFAIIGALTFWVLLPVLRQTRGYLAARSAE